MVVQLSSASCAEDGEPTLGPERGRVCAGGCVREREVRKRRMKEVVVRKEKKV